MKHFKHLLITALTLFVAFALAVPAFAADISVKDEDTHTYKVYQVLTGTLDSAGSNQLGNVQWGADVQTPTDGKVLGKTAQEFVNSIENLQGQALAEEVAKYINTSSAGQGELSKGHPVTNLATGYYILVDTTTPLEWKDDDEVVHTDTKAMHVIQVLNDIDGIDIKWGTTEDSKKIVSDTLGNGNSTHKPDDPAGQTNDVSVGDTINYQTTATVPSNANLYNYFYFIMEDTLDEGLTFTDGSIVVKAGDTELTENTDYLLRTQKTEPKASNGKTFEIALRDAKAHAGEDIVVTYSAVLNEKAKIGEQPNDNTERVHFSNDPNFNYDGENNPGFPDEESNPPMGDTPEKKTHTYTTGIELLKVDQDGNVLTGATFSITGPNTEIVLTSVETFEQVASGGTHYKLKNDTYTTEDPVTADYMKPAASGATKGYVVAESDYTGIDTITVDGIVYRPYKSGDTGDVYILVKANADQYVSTTKDYKKTVTYTQQNSNSGTTSVQAAVGADGVVRFVGLGEGDYVISETVTPPGYNTVADVTVGIKFNYNPATEEYHWTKTSSDATYDPTDGVFKLTIVNNKGTELPSTGGMGTTILYIIGGTMILAGIVMYFTKRRLASMKG